MIVPPCRRLLPSILTGLVTVCAFVGTVQAFDVPPNDGYVTDTAGLLTPDQKLQLDTIIADERLKSSNEIAVAIVPSLNGEAIADVAVEIGRAWGVGTAQNDNGILMLVSRDDREIFIATGYGLEGALPDIVTKGIVDEDIVPQFKEGAYFEGIKAGIEAMQKHISGEYTADRYAKSSTEGVGFVGFIFFAGMIILQWLLAFLGRTKSWWLGGVLGAIGGIVLTILFAWWLSIPLLTIIGFLADYVASKNAGKLGKKGRSGWTGWGGGGWSSGGGGSSGGSFGGFGGGSFGGGGAGGRWERMRNVECRMQNN